MRRNRCCQGIEVALEIAGKEKRTRGVMFSTGAGYGHKTWAFLKKEDQYRTLQQRFLLAAQFLQPVTAQDTSHAFRSTSPLECTPDAGCIREEHPP